MTLKVIFVVTSDKARRAFPLYLQSFLLGKLSHAVVH